MGLSPDPAKRAIQIGNLRTGWTAAQKKHGLNDSGEVVDPAAAKAGAPPRKRPKKTYPPVNAPPELAEPAAEPTLPPAGVPVLPYQQPSDASAPPVPAPAPAPEPPELVKPPEPEPEPRAGFFAGFFSPQR